MIKLHNKPENLVETSAKGRYRNTGGRMLTAEEAPNGVEIEAGSTFDATEDWYEQRRHWHFLEKVSDVEEPPEKESESTEDPTDEIDAMTKAELIAAIGEHGVIATMSSTKDQLREQLTALILAAG